MLNNYPTIIKQHLAEIFCAASAKCFFKVPMALAFGALTFLFGETNHDALIALTALISIDLVTALIAKYKIGEEIESRKVLKSVTKLVIYGLFVSAAHLTERIVPGATFMDEVAISFLAVTELVSVMENIAKMGYSMPQKLLNNLKQIKEQK